MSDFTSSGWSIYVAIGSILSIAVCWLLLWFTIKTRVPSATDNTTGHVWDENLQEMNNPLPRWWMWLFVITIVFSIAYVAAFPGLGSYPGMLNWSSTGQHQMEMDTAKKELAPLYAKYAAMQPADVAKDKDAHAIGQRIFMNNCAQCHGSDAKGSKGFPNLTDGDWMWGGSFDQIKETITKGRTGAMPPLAAAIGGADDLDNLANYVMSLSKAPHDAAKADKGKEKFVVCAACHGTDGKGNPAVGAPNLTDDVWLHGRSVEQIKSMVTHGKNNVMPAQEANFTPEQIHLLASYVWGLSNQGAK